MHIEVMIEELAGFKNFLIHMHDSLSTAYTVIHQYEKRQQKSINMAQGTQV
jgi:hypothetical protein